MPRRLAHTAFLVDDYDEERAFLERAGVDFESAARDEPYGRVSVFRDLWGNRWDLIGPPVTPA